ncbi:NUDIX hydrolase [Spelaeicoccus albus]|uniref:8-oxo-dGTP diphosphatase n=1 Tax=Spelaeicoccus albus TaxID=1280376 RepID=A0A7Z0D1B8_9MICO|nr:NUDIX domain-containing protein [Spelaeicoccus albus]NYI65982.1 8-oxo-dGTP diphosphatase [Spelaeicoccus albus]
MPAPMANVSERRFDPPSLAISTVVFALSAGAGNSADDESTADGATLWLPLVRRIREPYRNTWALPGGPIAWNESLEAAARRNLHETTDMTPNYLEQLYAFGGTDRSPDLRVVSIVYWALVRPVEADKAVTGDNVRWFRTGNLPELAFDHRDIVDYAVWRLRNKMEYSRIAQNFLGDTFTLAQLREVYESVIGRRLDPANFRRQMLASNTLIETDQVLAGARHRPPRLYRYKPELAQGSTAS